MAKVTKLEAGVKAPAFALFDQHGNKIESSSFKGEKLLVYFYPRAMTPGCTVQACTVRDSLAQLNKIGLKVVAISPDSPDRLKKFDEKQNLGFTLLSDPEKSVADAYGAVGEKTMFGKKSIGIIRSSFLIDEKGKVVAVWYKVKPDQTVALALEALGRL
jgi:peroxiredoxin Q/BCP